MTRARDVADRAIVANAVGATELDLTDTYAFTGTVTGAGTVLQVVSATETAASSFSNSGTFADVNGLTLNITPASTSSKIMLIASVAASVQNTNADGLVLQFTGGNSTNYIGDTAGSRISGAVGMKTESTNFHFYFVPFPFPMQYLDSPATTSQITYKVQAKYTGGTGTLYFNHAGQDGDNNTHVRTASTLTAMEIGA
jgi:hypothetical protein